MNFFLHIITTEDFSSRSTTHLSVLQQHCGVPLDEVVQLLIGLHAQQLQRLQPRHSCQLAAAEAIHGAPVVGRREVGAQQGLHRIYEVSLLNIFP